MKMRKTEKEIKKNLRNELSSVEPTDELESKVFSKVAFHPSTKRTVPFKKYIPALVSSLCIILLFIVGTVVVTFASQKAKENNNYNAIVQVDVNPSIEMVVDKNKQVLSVRGLNDEGKMMIEGEMIIGKTLDEALDTIIRIETELGYLVVNGNDNQIQVTVSAKTDEIYYNISNNVEQIVSNACEKVGVTATIDRMKGYAIDQLRELASELDPTLTEEEINALTYDQLVNVVKLYHLEVIDLASVKLEELYQKAKQYDIHFTEKEAVKQAVDSLDVVYQASIALYDDIYLQLDNAYQTIQETYQQYFINENSSYQQALKKLAEKKNELIVQRNLVANLSEDTDSLTRIEETAKLSFLETEYAAYEQSLKTAEQIAENVYAATCEIFDSLLTKMKELENELPESISAITFATLQDTESKMNAYKDNFFTNFEQEFAEEIAKQKNNLQQRKKELKESLH